MAADLPSPSPASSPPYQDQSPQTSSLASPPRAKCRVLIVEDDAASGGALRSILTRKGCDVHVALTLTTGQRMLMLSPDHVILDLMLPDGDGMDILRRMHDLGQSHRVTVTTALVDSARLQQVQALKPHRILRKPIDLVDLLNAIGMI